MEKNKAIENLNYQQSITLLNGNILIIHQKGIMIYDSSLSNKTIIEIYSIEDGDPLREYNKTTISRFSEKDYGYIISTIRDIIYIFDCEGNILNKYSTVKLSGYSFTIVPIKREGKKFTYMIGFIERSCTSYNMMLNFFDYDSNNNMTNFILQEKFVLEGKQTFFLSCQLMLNTTKNDGIIVCFTDLYYIRKINASYINPISYKRIINTTEEASFIYSTNSAYIVSLKTAISSDKQKCLVCFAVESKAYCSIFFVYNNSFSEVKHYADVDCKSNIHFLNIFYMRETNQFILSMVQDGNTIINMFSMDDNFTVLSNYKSPTSSKINNIQSFSIIYSYDFRNYYLILGTKDITDIKNYYNFTSTTIDYINGRINNITLCLEEEQNHSSGAILNTFTTYIEFTTQIIPPTI